MDQLEYYVQNIEFTLSTKRKRHIVGGILISISLLFAGLAITTITLQEDNENE